MTVSISNMTQVWMSNTNTYNGIAMSISTMGYGANTNSRLLRLKVDGNTKFDIDANGIVRTSNIVADTISVNTFVSLSSISSNGSITANGYVFVRPSDGNQEGGEIQLLPSNNYVNWILDSYQNNHRTFTTTNSTLANVIYFNAGGGVIRMGVNRSDPNYTLDVAGTANAALVLDSKGDVRDLPINNKVASYTLTSDDTGKILSTNSSIVIPNAIFSTGQAISVYNNSSSTIAISNAAGVLMRLAGQANNQNRSLAQYGIATIICVSSNTFVISGAGLS